MRIALISFEFPPSIGVGGIGAYSFEAARMLAGGGYDVEVFAAGPTGDEPAQGFGVHVHRVDVVDRMSFREAIVPIFAERHASRPFDVLESPEYGAEGLFVSRHFPEVAVVTKLHTPSYLVERLSREKINGIGKARFFLGGLRRGRWARITESAYDREEDLECIFTLSADLVVAPSRSIGEIVANDWQVDRCKICCIPYPYRPQGELLSLPVAEGIGTIGFLGRLEARKGVVELSKAIPKIIRKAPHLRFRFLGPSLYYRETDMESWIKRKCSAAIENIDFVGTISRARLAEELRLCDVMILPSRWENFPFACWESMAAGRAVIGSAAGGMTDVIENELSGLLIAPNSPGAIVAAILDLVKNPEKVEAMGCAGRSRVIEQLSPQHVLPLQVAGYVQAIEMHKSKK